MVYSCRTRTEGIDPGTRAIAPHAAPPRAPLRTGCLPGRPSRDPRHAGLRQPWPKRPRIAPHRGREIPYANPQLPAAGTVLPLMTSIVLTSVRGLLMAALGRPALLAAGRLAARPGPVAIAAVATAAHGEREPTPPAVPQVQDGSLGRCHRSLLRWGAGRTRPACARLQLSGLGLGSLPAGRGTTRKPRRQTGV